MEIISYQKLIKLVSKQKGYHMEIESTGRRHLRQSLKPLFIH